MIAYPLLVLEAATAEGSVALFVSQDRAYSRSVTMGASRQDMMMPAIDELCRDAGITVGDIRSVVCGAGPGSFTSLRIAGSIAKGIVHANRLMHGSDVQLFAVSSLLLAAASIETPGDYIVHSDAMRGERYVQRVRVGRGGDVEAIGAIHRASVASLVEASNASGTDTVQRVAVTAASADLSDDRIIIPRAELLLRVSGWGEQAVDLVSWEPAYGRLAEAQVKWEAAHGTPLPVAST